MITKDFNIKIDFEKAVLNPYIKFVQGDTKSCKLSIDIFKNGIKQDLTDISVGITFLRADNTQIEAVADITNAIEGKAEYILASNILDIPGQVITEIALYGPESERLTHSVQLTFEVIEELGSETNIVEDDRYPVLAKLISDATEFKNAENNRVIAEASRINAEVDRDQQESNRQNSETQRQAAELDRDTRFEEMTTKQQQDAEVINARTSTVKSITYPSLNKRIESAEEDIKKTQEPEYATVGPTTSSMISVPDSAINGKLRECKIEGQSVNQIVKNGNFADGSTDWVGDNATLTASNNVLSVTGTGGTIYPYVTQYTNTPAINGNKIYVRVKAKVTNSVCTNISLSVRGTTSGTNDYIVTQASPIENTEYILHGIVTITDQTPNIRIQALHQYVDATTANGKVMEVKEVMAIDMTAEGLDTLTANEMNARFPHWLKFSVNSTLSACRIVSTGKNKFNKTKRIESYYTNTSTGVLVSSTTLDTTDYIPVKANQQYVYSHYEGYVLFDQNKNFISGASGVNAFVPVQNGYVRINIKKENVDSFQIEEGTSTTTYEEYKESITYIKAPKPLRNVGTGVTVAKDEVRLSDGEVDYRTKEIILDGSESWVDKTSSVTDDGIHSLFLIGDLTTDIANNPVFRNDVLPSTGISFGGYSDAYSKGEGFSLYKDGSYIYIVIKKTRLNTPDLAGFKQWLSENKISLIYQLVESARVTLKSGEGGFEISGKMPESFGPRTTFQIDPWYHRNFVYGTNIAFDYKVLKFNEIKKVVGVDFEEIDIATITIASDNKSITIPGASNGDVYFIDAEIDPSEHGGQMFTGEVPNDSAAQRDGNTKNISITQQQLSDFMAKQNAINLSFDFRLTVLEP